MWLRRHTRHNSLGFRDEEVGPRASGERRVAVLGDSLIYGYCVADPGARATEVLGRLLEERGAGKAGQPAPVRVLNVAKPGAGTVL